MVNAQVRLTRAEWVDQRKALPGVVLQPVASQVFDQTVGTVVAREVSRCRLRGQRRTGWDVEAPPQVDLATVGVALWQVGESLAVVVVNVGTVRQLILLAFNIPLRSGCIDCVPTSD